MAFRNVTPKFPSYVDLFSKECTKCLVIKPFTDFYKKAGGFGTAGRDARCKSCKNEYTRSYISSKPRWKTTANGRAYYAKNRELLKARQAASRREVKRQLIAAYGGMCACCGESDSEFLTIDHIDGTGHLQRARPGGISGDGYYRRLRKQGFPKENHQLLCWNCNCAKAYYGQCPHIRQCSEILSWS